MTHILAFLLEIKCPAAVFMFLCYGESPCVAPSHCLPTPSHGAGVVVMSFCLSSFWNPPKKNNKKRKTPQLQYSGSFHNDLIKGVTSPRRSVWGNDRFACCFGAASAENVLCYISKRVSGCLNSLVSLNCLQSCAASWIKTKLTMDSGSSHSESLTATVWRPIITCLWCCILSQI